MCRARHIIHLLTLIIVGLISAGCRQLQPGYYLTPENYPTPPGGFPTSAPLPNTATPTPLSTLRAVGEVIPTATSVPTATVLPTATPYACEQSEGQMVFETVVSQITGREMDYRVYLPPCYTLTGRSYPLLIIMHGLVPGSTVMNDDQWDRMGLDEAADEGYLAGTLAPMVIVMPDGNDARHGDDNSPFGRVVAEELLPDVEAKFCTQQDSAGRAIGGLSRGGFWAYSVAFLNPGLFDRVGGHSPFLYDGDYRVYNPYNLIDEALGIERLTMYIDHGAQDYVEVGVREFIRKLERRSIEPEYVVNPEGAHNEDYWSAHVAEYLAYYAADWSRDVETFPVCEH